MDTTLADAAFGHRTLLISVLGGTALQENQLGPMEDSGNRRGGHEPDRIDAKAKQQRRTGYRQDDGQRINQSSLAQKPGHIAHQGQ